MLNQNLAVSQLVTSQRATVPVSVHDSAGTVVALIEPATVPPIATTIMSAAVPTTSTVVARVLFPRSSKHLPLFLLPLRHRGGKLQTAQDHGDADCEGADCTLGYYPAHAFDIGAGVRVQGHGDAVVEFLQLDGE